MKVDQIRGLHVLDRQHLWAFCFVAIIPFLFLLPITHDAIWQIWIGRQILHGAHLYTDIIEVNPPLWFWIAVPMAEIGDLFGIEARSLIIGFFSFAIGLSLYLSPKRYWPLLLIALILLPLRDFGQREHFTLIASLPYVFLIAARAEGTPVSHPLFIGLFAATGFALKPHFAFVPLALELLVWSKPRIRPETLAIGLSACTYAVAILVFSPAYISDVWPVIRQAYDSYQGGSTLTLLLSAFGLATAGALLGRRTGSDITRAMALASLAFLLAVLLQNKGWPYHSIPARALLFLSISIELVRCRAKPITDGLMTGAAILCFHPVGLYENRFRSESEKHLAGVPQGASVAFLSTNPMMAWPMVDDRKLAWNPTQMGLWQLNAVVFSNKTNLLPPLRARVARDLAKHPDLVVVDRRPVLGPVVASVIPKGFLNEYSLKLSTPNMVSYTRKSKSAMKH